MKQPLVNDEINPRATHFIQMARWLNFIRTFQFASNLNRDIFWISIQTAPARTTLRSRHARWILF